MSFVEVVSLRIGRETVNTQSQSIVTAALGLPERQRAEVVQELLASLSPDAENVLDDLWAAELDRRSAEWQSGEVEAVPWNELKLQR
jgi:putative addiction module component (TIGR02574 family)